MPGMQPYRRREFAGALAANAAAKPFNVVVLIATMAVAFTQWNWLAGGLLFVLIAAATRLRALSGGLSFVALVVAVLAVGVVFELFQLRSGPAGATPNRNWRTS